MKLLVLTSRFPYPLEKGDKLRLYHQIKVMAKTHEIILVSLAPEKVSPTSLKAIEDICSKVYYFNLSKVHTFLNLSVGILKGLPAQVAFFYNKKIQKSIHQIIQEEQPDHIYCQLIRTAEYLKGVTNKMTLDYMDSFSLGMKRRAEQSNAILRPIINWESRNLAKYEQNIFDQFNQHCIISKQDRDLLSFKNAPKIKVIPNGVDTLFFKPNSEIEEQFDLVFVGNMGYYPNVEAVKFLAKKVLPIVKKFKPNIKILIAGARPTTEVKNLQSKHIEIAGWVDDIRTAYASGRIFVAPIFTGSGQQNKILEAMAMERACITSNIVNNAIKAVDEKSIVIANNEEEFAQKIIDLLDHKPKRLEIAKAGRSFVCDQYSWEFYTRQLMELFEI